jgi:hypothetical protein
MADKRTKHNKLISQCPVCGGQLAVTHLRCGSCDTELAGEFMANEFARLPEDKLAFLRTFLACRGNLKLVEQELSISYPTVRGRLDQLLEVLNLHAREAREDETAAAADNKADVLEALARGEINIDEAERRLRS